MSKFTYLPMSNDEGTVIVFNRSKYTKEEVLKLGKEELASLVPEWKDCEVVLFESFIRHGFGFSSDFGFANDWWIRDVLEPVKRKHKNELAVWCVRPSDKALDY